ncbi:MAG: hypothetical protein AB7T06_28250 [Kofleriaceae bacterium]
MWRTTVLLLALSGTAFAEDDGTTKGAVPVLGEYVEPAVTINHRDTTVTLDELPKLSATWKKRARVAYKGNVPMALNHSYAHVNLTFVGETNDESGYPHALKRFPLVPTDDAGPWSSSFPGFAERGSPRGPILAAIRVLPSRNGGVDPPAPESERRQVVVYMPKGKRVILVATKLVTDTEWTPLLRLDVPNAKSIDLIDPGWH